MDRIAILDLGTNTFNLLIVQANGNCQYDILVNKKLPVKLGEGKMRDGKIIPAAFNRGIDAINTHFQSITDYKVGLIKAFGTSALRTAENGNEFLEQIKTNSGIDVHIISGEKEAELIYYGARQTIDLNNEKFVILDIGGGSNEFIVSDMNGIIWKHSYPLGIARLLDLFNPSDPITENEIETINKHLSENLQPLFEKLDNYNIRTLIGASGSFETFVTMINQIDVNETECALSEKSTAITVKDFIDLNSRLLKSTFTERSKMKGLERMRVEMIVLASHFVKFILDNHKFERIIQSNYALKEGAVYEILKEDC